MWSMFVVCIYVNTYIYMECIWDLRNFQVCNGMEWHVMVCNGM